MGKPTVFLKGFRLLFFLTHTRLLVLYEVVDSDLVPVRKFSFLWLTYGLHREGRSCEPPMDENLLTAVFIKISALAALHPDVHQVWKVNTDCRLPVDHENND